ncbi:type IV toxin-antitoxin system AbiEi family antitoxin [Pseudomarimonas salicorniae]|uniref:Type IV toxin-antitoxin system AbiEi family antitoxin n=1 Tax=Pseudomarimonas salicorniae TaxID=2933270 RepID=A0ABT0GCN8_9GAMM|nr:type IV toxin-antitoxin system AbiEi family antitoxin [Lysobacter sp. CAU 1642]MCK7592293.1 type IV toxin-antitoxin system AbiEi family antitoxin [Lysobacter sp. CAU 1642]
MNENDLIQGVAEALEQLGVGLTARAELQPTAAKRHVDAILAIARGKARHEFVIETKPAIGPATLGAALAQLDHAEHATRLPGLLVTERITPPMAERLRELKRGFVDLAGNCYLETPDFLVYVVGRKPEAQMTVSRGGQAFTPAGLKVLFALICEPELANATQRTIAANAGVALGTVPTVLADLRQTGRLLKAGRNQRLNSDKRLLDEWAMGYAQQLRPKLLVATHHAPQFETWKEWPVEPYRLRWGGEPAAHLLEGYLQPGVLTLYGDKMPLAFMAKQQLRPVGLLGTHQALEVRKPFWGKPLEYQGRADTVAPALVYADLLATGEARCLETAGRVYDELLARLFPAG